MRTLAPRERRLAAILLLVVAAALILFAIVLPVMRGFADRAERRRELLADYARDERALAQLPSIGRAAAAQRRRVGLFRMAAPDPSSAAAALAERLTAAVAGVGGDMRGVEDPAAPPGEVRARLQAGVTLAGAVTLVDRLRNTPPLLQIDALDLGAHDAADDPRPGLLDLRLEVSAALSPTSPR